MPQLCIDLTFLPQKPTGLGTYALNLLDHLNTQGVTLLSARPRDGYNHYLVPASLASDRGRQAHLARLVWQQVRVPEICRILKADLLFSPVPEAPLDGPCPTVVTVHDLIPLRFPGPFPSLLTKYFQFYIPRVLHRAAHIICDSEATAQDIVQFYNIAPAKITPIPLAHDAAHFYPRALPVGNYFLYLGRQDAHKNLDRLITAFARLKGDCELWLAGPPDPRRTPMLKAQIAAMSLGRRVRFLDYVPYEALPALIEQAIALVFPTLWEGFGLPVLEAMACGTPVITSSLASLPEVAGDAALYVDPYCVASIAEAMHAVASTANLRTALRERGLVRAAQFSWQKTAEATAAALARYL